VNFLATTAGSYSATLTIANNASSGGSATVALSGTVTAPVPVASLSATAITFPSMLAGATAVAQTVTLTNTGTGVLTITGITITGTNASNFSETTTCGSTLAVGANCTVTVNFAAASAGSYSAALAIANNSSTNPATVALSGTATAPVLGLSATSLTFPSMVAGGTATTQVETLTNTGTAPLTISGITITGTNASDFSATANTCGATLAVGANCTVTLSFSAATAGTYTATLNIANNSAGGTGTVALSGTATAPVPVASLSATSIAFPSMLAGATATAQTETLTNTGTGPLTINGITITGTSASNFSETTTCGATLAVGANCTVTVNFAAASAGSYTAALAIANNSSTNPATVALSGTTKAPAPVAGLSVTTIAFPSMVAGATATAQTVTLTNSGTGALTISGITITGTNLSNFSQTNTCGTLPATLAVGANCTVTVNFAAASAGSYTAALAIANNSSTNPATVALSGTTTTPVPVAGLSATSLTFPSMLPGATATAQTVTLTNSGTGALTISGITITGTNASNFSETTTCGATLAVGANCTVTVNFTATTVGSYSGTLAIANNSSTNPATVALSGAVAVSQVSLSPSTVTFASMVAGATATAQTVTLTNGSASTLTIASIALSGTGANLFSKTTTCGATLAAGANCTISPTFVPKVAGSYTATLTVTDNADGTTGSTQTAAVSGTATPFTITINNSTANNWVIDNGAITLDWDQSSGKVFGMMLDGTSDNLVDTTYTHNNEPYGLYMDNAYPTDFANGTPTFACTISGGTVVGTPTTACTVVSGSTPYLDWSETYPDSASTSNAFTFTEHWLVFPNDPGVHNYVELNHSTSDIAGTVGQMQWVFRDSQTLFNNSYEVNPSLTSPGAGSYPVLVDLPRPSLADNGGATGRTVQDATGDLHGYSDIPGAFGRYFDTKYDFAGYEYLHQAHGMYGTKYGAWTYLPKSETLVGGPTKQDLYFTGNIDMIEAYSNHEDNGMSLNVAAGTAYNRLFGPFYIHFNTIGMAYTTIGNTLATPADMYADALQAGASFATTYDNVKPLTDAGYVPTSGRGTVSLQINGVTGVAHTAWAVLSDPAKNFQYSSAGYQYWADISNNGTATIAGVAPGTYRLSVYVLGQWGELRQDGIVVTAGQTTTVPTVSFVPENFGTTLFTIGTPDRSSHEFLHGHMANGNDDREYLGTWNYWADFLANQGAVIYNGTAGPNGAATNDLSKWNYTHWRTFDPGLYDPSNNTTDNYTNTIPSYVAGLAGATGTNGVTTVVPNWQIHFATPSNIATYSSGYVDLSVSVACAEGSYVVTLNGYPTGSYYAWHYTNASDCMIRSGLSGYTQWFVMEFPVSALNATVGADNVISISMSSSGSAEDDALRLELSNTGANPTTTGWNDYTYINSKASTPAAYNNDLIPNP
jgi:hypothetical protein